MFKRTVATFVGRDCDGNGNVMSRNAPRHSIQYLRLHESEEIAKSKSMRNAVSLRIECSKCEKSWREILAIEKKKLNDASQMSGRDKRRFGKMMKMLKKSEWRGEKQERWMVVVRKDSHLNTIGVIHTMLVGIVGVVIKAGKCREVVLIIDNALIPTTLILLPN